MDFVKNVKDISSDMEEGLKDGLEKTKQKLASVASHLPFINMAKNKHSQYTIEVDLPGVRKEDIDLSIDGNTLSVSAERCMKEEVKKEDYYHLSSYFGKIARSFTLPESIDKDKLDAEYKDGRLYIRLNESEKKKPQQVSIK